MTSRRNFLAGLLASAAVAPMAGAAAATPSVHWDWAEPADPIADIRAWFLANAGPRYRFKDPMP